MKILGGPRLPTPFGGSIKLPDLETPPLSLPQKPDATGMKALGHALGEDVASELIGRIPVVGSTVGDILSDMHHAEILKILPKEDFQKFTYYNKTFPSTVAMARTLLFKEVKTAKELPKAKQFLPMPPRAGPPLPQFMGVRWPKAKE